MCKDTQNLAKLCKVNAKLSHEHTNTILTLHYVTYTISNILSNTCAKIRKDLQTCAKICKKTRHLQTENMQSECKVVVEPKLSHEHANRSTNDINIM